MIESIKFPEIPEGELTMCWNERGVIYVGVVDMGDFVKVYKWDGIADAWNVCDVYQKVGLK